MQSYLIFSCRRPSILLKKVKTLLLNQLEELKIDDGEEQQCKDTLVEPFFRRVTEIVGHVDGEGRYGQQKMIDGPIGIEVKRDDRQCKHAK